jgi:hypothetical protein
MSRFSVGGNAESTAACFILTVDAKQNEPRQFSVGGNAESI